MSTVNDSVRPAVRWGVEHALPRQVLRLAERRGDLQARLVSTARERSTPEMAGLFDEIRSRGPMVKTKFAYLTVDHAAVKEALTSPHLRTGFPFPETGPMARVLTWAQSETLHPVKAPSLLVVDGPDHARYRKLVTKVFTARAVESLRGRVEQLAADLLDELATESANGAPVDIVEAYCARLPVMVIAEILGVPEADHDKVRGFGEAAAPSLDMGLDWRTYRRVDRGLLAFDQWLDEHLERLRHNPGDNLMSKLAAERDDEGGLDNHELKATAGLVLAAGFETTVNLLSNGIALLAQHRDQRNALLSGDAEWSGAVDEVLRFDPPVLLTGRSVVEPTTIGGTEVHPGTAVTTLLAGANRDPALFEHPHTFDVTRQNARDHMAFSAGRHYCLGASLARLEGEIGLRALSERFPELTLAGPGRRRATRVLRGFEELPVRTG